MRPMHGHQVKHPRCLLVLRAGPPRAEDGPALIDDLGLDKKVAECGVQRVCHVHQYKFTPPNPESPGTPNPKTSS